jgi:hypothetical protein
MAASLAKPQQSSRAGCADTRESTQERQVGLVILLFAL